LFGYVRGVIGLAVRRAYRRIVSGDSSSASWLSSPRRLLAPSAPTPTPDHAAGPLVPVPIADDAARRSQQRTISRVNFGWEICSTGGVAETLNVTDYPLTATPK
jgi:hypothetical protein